jgi:hypothetical protein
MVITRFLLTPAAVVLALACGPSIELQDETSSSDDGSTGTVATTTPPPSTTTSTSTSTTTSTSTSTGEDTTLDDTTGVLFLIEPDGGVCVVSGDGHWHCSECDLFAQDCPDGEKCMPWANDGGNAWNATRCSPIAESPGQPGDGCTVEGSGTSGLDDCDLSVMCWNVDPETNVGTCVAMCTGDEANPSCPGETSCVIANDGALLLCLPPCDPLAAACPTEQTCTAVDDDPVCIPSTGVDVWPCGPAVCAPDQTCLDAELLAACMDFGCCAPWCDLTAAEPDVPCAAEPAHSCQAYYAPGEAPAGLEHVGVCRLPA